MNTLKASLLFCILSSACGDNSTVMATQADAGNVEHTDGSAFDAEVNPSTPNEAETKIIEPESSAMEIVGFGERCTEGANLCEPGLLCDGWFCLGSIGWTCDTHAECADELRCLQGECQLPVQVGENDRSCTNDSDCEDESACSGGACGYPLNHWCPNDNYCGQGLICSEFHCNVALDDPCSENSDCPWYALCLDQDGDGATHCGKQSFGGSCGFDRQCDAGLLCDSGLCMTASGVECGSDEECAGEGSRCLPLGDEHHCAEPIIGGGCDDSDDCPTGTSCAQGRCGYPLFASCGDTDECHPDLVCDANTSLCLKQEGGECGADSECGEPFRCRPTLLSDGLSRCLEPQVGSPCEENEDCPIGIECRADRCVRGIGESCTRSSECEEGIAVCQPPRDPSLDCHPLDEAPPACLDRRCYLVDSATCESDEECAWGLNCVPQNSATPSGAHHCRPRIPGIECDEESECPAGIPCNNHRCVMGHGEYCSGAQPCAAGLVCSQWIWSCGGEFVNRQECRLPCEHEELARGVSTSCVPELPTDNRRFSGGVYHCGNTTPSEAHAVFRWAHMIDTGEDCDDVAHIYYETYSCDVPLNPFDPTEAQAYLLQEKRELPGPHLLVGLQEWLCNEWMVYDESCIAFAWPSGADCVVLRLYESDSCHLCPDWLREEYPWGCTCGWWLFTWTRTHDTIFLGEIRRSATEQSCGATYEGHYCGRCDEGSCYPCISDGNTTGELNLRTITP